jgi:hypothetical protein
LSGGTLGGRQYSYDVGGCGAGFYALYARGAYEPEALTHVLGERFEIDDIEGSAQLVREHCLDLNDIAKVRLVGSRLNLMLAEPTAQKRRPATAIDAKFSLPFTVATAMHGGTVTLDDFTPRAAHRGS